jgi:DNA-binding NtrC family response regulator
MAGPSMYKVGLERARHFQCSYRSTTKGAGNQLHRLPRERPRENPPDERTGTMARILIVDDEEDVRFTLADTLKSRRHEVYEAADGDRALKILSEQDIDLVVTDILMPNREGLETIQEIRMNWPDVKIIAMSGGGRIRNTEFLKVAKKLGADFIIKKPFSMSEFRNQVDRMLDASLWQGE